MIILIFFFAHWYLSLFSQTFFLHRYAAHQMFTMSPFWEKFFYIFTYVTQGSSFLSPRAYGILHRMHHAYSDTEQDPHSPHHASNVFTMMWQTKNIYNDHLNYRVIAEEKFTKNIPMWHFIETLGDMYVSRLFFGILYTLFYVQFATEWWMFALLPLHFLMGPIHGAIVNYSGHMHGYSNYDNGDKSKNTLVWDFLCFGELFQNNHHKFAAQPNFAMKKFEFDPTFQVIRLLDKIGIIKLKIAS